MDDRFIILPKHLDFNSFSICFNNLHPAIKCTLEKAKVVVENSDSCQVINFLDVSVILHSDSTIETDIYYKDTTPMITSFTTVRTQIILKIMYHEIKLNA